MVFQPIPINSFLQKMVDAAKLFQEAPGAMRLGSPAGQPSVECNNMCVVRCKNLIQTDFLHIERRKNKTKMNIISLVQKTFIVAVEKVFVLVFF